MKEYKTETLKSDCSSDDICVAQMVKNKETESSTFKLNYTGEQRFPTPTALTDELKPLNGYHLPVSLRAEVADEVTRPEQGPRVSAEGR